MPSTNITKPGSGDLTGFRVLTIDMAKMYSYINEAIARRIKYLMGAKDHKLGTNPPDYSKIDCSGFAQAVLAVATNGATIGHMPEGSYDQDDWCKAAGFKHHAVTSAEDYIRAVGAVDNHPRICFHHSGGRGNDPTGHVWLALRSNNGTGSVVVSFESYGGNGPGSRPINHQWFCDHCDDIYVLA